MGKADLVDFPVVLNFIHSRHATPALSHVSGTQPPRVRVFQPVRKNAMKAVDSANVQTMSFEAVHTSELDLNSRRLTFECGMIKSII